MIKICHVTSVHDMDDVRICKKECISLAKNKEYDVKIVGPGTEKKEYKGVKMIGVGNKPQSRIKRMTKYTDTVISAALKEDADIYHFHDPELLKHVLKFKKKSKKVIFDSHENILDSIDEKQYLPWIFRKAAKLYFMFLQWKVLRKIDAIIVVSPQMIDTYKKYNRNVILISNYPIIDNIDSDLSVETVKGRFVFAGGVRKEWCHKEIINALNNIDGTEYYLFGPEEDNYIEELKDLDGWRKVHYGGRIPFEQVQQEIRKAQFAFAILRPNKNSFGHEGTLGNTKLFESMVNGKPVIATDFVLWKDIIEKNDCGICVDPSNQTEIENAIRYFIECSDDRVLQMGQNGRKAVLEQYNWSKQEEILFKAYRDLC